MGTARRLVGVGHERVGFGDRAGGDAQPYPCLYRGKIWLGEQMSNVLVIRQVRAWTEYDKHIGRQIT
jgi:hypothetical protein